MSKPSSQRGGCRATGRRWNLGEVDIGAPVAVAPIAGPGNELPIAADIAEGVAVVVDIAAVVMDEPPHLAAAIGRYLIKFVLQRHRHIRHGQRRIWPFIGNQRPALVIGQHRIVVIALVP